mgnify:CR=1 FL=1
MDSEQKRTLVLSVLFFSFLLGLLDLSRILDPYTMHTAVFMGEERRVTVRANGQAVGVGDWRGGREIFKKNDNIMTRFILAVPRRGIHTWTRAASTEEVVLFRQFF